MSIYNCVQGDSLWIDYTLPNITDIDGTWGNWGATWNIAVVPGGTTLLSGGLTQSTTVGVFNFRIGPVSGGSTWITLPVGSYTLSVQMSDTSIDFKHEEQDVLNITPQGV